MKLKGRKRSTAKKLELGRSPIVDTKSGQVEGFTMASSKGPINVFLGIPYANPPTGERRFAKTEPVSPWLGVLKCKKYRRRPPQKDYLWDRIELKVGKSEDCLYLNIVTPSWKPPADQPGGLPVMFYIHGGGYVIDSAVKYRYQRIAKMLAVHGIIVVTIQYRLGYLGYFCTGDSHCIGNFGLWDQATALKWVSENIESFGGDPKRITVAGQSAGAASADLLSLSPYTRDLFDKLILMGGNAECAWAVCETKKAVEYCRKHAQKLGWRGEDNEAMMAYLRTLPAQKLGDGMIGNKVIFEKAHLPLAPVIDGDLLPRPVQELRNEVRNKKTIIGVTEDEGLLFVAIGRMACDVEDIKRGIRMISEAVEGTGIDVAAVVNDVYIKDENHLSSKKFVNRIFVDMLDDVMSNFGCALYAEKMAKRGETVYMYSLEHCNPASFGPLGLLIPFRNATHATELVYIFGSNIFVSPFCKNAKDRKVMKEMTRFWTNFIKTGDPNKSGELGENKLDVEWAPVTEENVERHLRIAVPASEMRTVFKDGRLTTLRKIFGNIPFRI